MLESIFESSTITTLSVWSLLICVLVAIILGLVIAITHMKTSKYSKNFIETLAILPILISIVIMMVNGNLGTGIAVAGAFSLVRFRSIPGTSKEIMSVFFAMAIGLAIGMGHVLFASIITFIVCLFIYVLYKLKLGAHSGMILTILVPENLDYTNMYDDLFQKYTNKSNLDKVKTTNMGSLYELTYMIEFKNNINEKQFIDDIRCRNGNLKVTLNHSTIEGEL